MAEPAWKTLAEVPDETAEEAAEECVLQRWVKGPEGRMELLELPLTRELFLNPQPGDKILQGEWHDITVGEISGILRNHFRPQPDVRVFHDMKHYLLPRRPAPGPDVSVVRGLRPRRSRSTFRVKREGVRPCLLIEVVSPSPEARRTDLEDKVELYQAAGILEYLIVDSPSGITGLPFQLLGYRLDATGRYQPMKPDAEGRCLSETTGIWFQVSPDGQRIFLFEASTGRRLLNLEEQEESTRREARGRKTAEEIAAREAKGRKAAEERAMREAEARKAAEEKATREAEARKAAEEKAARVEGEMARLRAEIDLLRGT